MLDNITTAADLIGADEPPLIHRADCPGSDPWALAYTLERCRCRYGEEPRPPKLNPQQRGLMGAPEVFFKVVPPETRADFDWWAWTEWTYAQAVDPLWHPLTRLAIGNLIRADALRDLDRIGQRA